MRLLALSDRGFACVLVGSIALAASSASSVETRLHGEVPHTVRSLQAAGGGDALAADVKECRAKQNDARGDLELDATAGVALRFSCGADLALSPAKGPDTTTVEKVYQYAGAGPEKACNTAAGSEVTLATAVEGATLTEEGGTQGNEEDREDNRLTKTPTYVFKYTTEPSVEKHLCYTCNTTSTTTAATTLNSSEDSPPTQARNLQASTPGPACTVYIKVPKMTEDQTATSTTTSPATPGPDAPSSARTMPLAIATAVGGFLAAMLRT